MRRARLQLRTRARWRRSSSSSSTRTRPAERVCFTEVPTRPSAVDAVVLLVKRRTPLTLGEGFENDVNEHILLGDGTAVLHTTRVLASRDMVALELGENHAAWVAEHDDARGVPSFGATRLASIRLAATYEAALVTLGDAVVFLQPQSADALLADRKAQLRSFFGKGES